MGTTTERIDGDSGFAMWRVVVGIALLVAAIIIAERNLLLFSRSIGVREYRGGLGDHNAGVAGATV